MGIFFSGFLSDKIGRKKSIIAASILTLMSALCVYFCTSFLTLASVLGFTTFFSSMVQVKIFLINADSVWPYVIHIALFDNTYYILLLWSSGKHRQGMVLSYQTPYRCFLWVLESKNFLGAWVCPIVRDMSHPVPWAAGHSQHLQR